MALLLVAGEAAPHATLITSTPADGERLDSSPAALALTFDEPVVPLSLTLVDDAGRRHGSGTRARVDGTRVTLGLESPLPDGGYIATYRITSLDSHVIAGAIAFSVGARIVPSAAHEAPSGPTWASVAFRSLQLVALLLTAGLTVYTTAVERLPAHNRWLAMLATFALLMTWLAFLRSNAAMSHDASGHSVGLASYVLTTVVAMAGAACALLATLKLPRLRIPALVAAGLLPAAIVLGGHAMTSTWRPLAASVLFVHLSVVGFWASSLLALSAAVRTDDGSAALRRFSAIAQFVVPLGIAAGLAFAVLEVRTIDNLSSDYARLALIKLGVTAALLTIATYNRFVAGPRLAGGDGAARLRLRANIHWEIALVLGLIVLGASLAATPPPRHAILERVAQGAGLRATIRVTPARVVDVHLARSGLPVDPLEVTIGARHDVASIGPLERTAVRVAPGHYRVTDLPLRVPGTWQILVRARIDDFTRLDLGADFALR